MKAVVLGAQGMAMFCRRLLAYLGKLLGIRSHSAVDCIARGDVFLAGGDYDKAVAEFTEAIRLAPRSPLGFRRRAAAFQAIGDALQTSLDSRKAVQLEAALQRPEASLGGQCGEGDHPSASQGPPGRNGPDEP